MPTERLPFWIGATKYRVGTYYILKCCSELGVMAGNVVDGQTKDLVPQISREF